MEIFNELTFAIVSYTFLLFTEFNQSSSLKTYIGWLLIILTLFNITVNYIIVIIKTATQLIKVIKNFIRKRRLSQKKDIAHLNAEVSRITEVK